MKRIVIYDFDGTLTPYTLPQYKVMEICGVKDGTNGSDFLEMVKAFQKENGDFTISWWQTYLHYLNNGTVKPVESSTWIGADELQYNPGLKQCLKWLNDHDVVNYVLSAGIESYLYQTAIASYFQKMFGVHFTKNEAGEITGMDTSEIYPSRKPDIIKKIMKENHLDDCSSIIYIGDGLTDGDAMKYVKENHGTSIFVYQSVNSSTIEKMKDLNVVDYFFQSDYSEGSELRKQLEELCR